MLGILILYPLPWSLGPQTPWKNGATSLQSSDFGWYFQSKHHHHFIDGPVGLWTTYVRYFDKLNLAWKSWTPNPLKKLGHWPPKFWLWMKFWIKTLPSIHHQKQKSSHRWPGWPPDDLWPQFLGVLGSETSRQGSIHQNTRPKSSGDQLGHLWSDGDVLIKKFAIIIRVIGWQPFIVWLYYMATDDDKAHMVKSVNYPSHHNQTLYVISIGGFFINLGKSPLIY